MTQSESDFYQAQLCVSASGFLAYRTLQSRMEIRKVILHLGQTRGKFSKTVSLRICVRVFPWHSGHRTHCVSFGSMAFSLPGFHKQHHGLEFGREHLPQLCFGKPAHSCSAQSTDPEGIDPYVFKEKLRFLLRHAVFFPDQLNTLLSRGSHRSPKTSLKLTAFLFSCMKSS